MLSCCPLAFVKDVKVTKTLLFTGPTGGDDFADQGTGTTYVCLPACLPACLFVCLSVCLSVCLTFYLSFDLPV